METKLMEIKAEDYRIWQDPETATIFFQGFLRLNGMDEYEPVMELLMQTAEQFPCFNLNMRELEFLNSSGISMLSMFIVKIRQKGNSQVVLQGSEKVLWQTKSLKNLQRLMPSMTLDFA